MFNIRKNDNLLKITDENLLLGFYRLSPVKLDIAKFTPRHREWGVKGKYTKNKIQARG
jgi:hypothetical protein